MRPLVNSVLKLVLCFALLAALGFGAMFLWLRSSAPAPLALEPEKPAAQPLEATRNTPVDAEGALASETPGSERTSVPKEAQRATPATETAAAQADTTIVAHMVDENLRPIANAWLRPMAEAQSAGRGAPVNEARSGSDGIATLHWKGAVHGGPVRFAAGADRYATLFPRGILKAGETLHLGDLTLRPGGSVRGRVIDKDQQPIAGARVIVSEVPSIWGSNDIEQLKNRGPETWEGAPESLSSEGGLFLVEGVPAGMTRAWAKTETLRWAVSPPLEIVAGVEVSDVLLVLEPEDKADADLRDIEGIVLDPNDKPVAKAKLQERQMSGGSSWSTGTNTGDDGRFVVHPRERGVRISLEFSDEEERYAAVKLDDVKPGTKGLVIRLEESRTIQLSVRDEHGPVEKYRVKWGLDDGDTRGNVDQDEAHVDGRAQVRVPARGAFYYQVLAPGHKPEKLGPLDGEKLPASLEVKLTTIPGIHGRVMAGDKPVSGAKLALHEQPTAAEIEMNGFTTLVRPEAETKATTDSEGRFTLELQRDDHFTIYADADGYARAQYGPLMLEAAKGLQDIVIQLDAGGTLEGKVLMPPGRSPAGVIVGINRGDAQPQTQVVGPEGSFRFEHLSVGHWEIQRCDEMFHGATGTSMSSGGEIKARDIRHDFTIALGQTAHMDLDLRNADPCLLEIELTHNGQPASAWSIVAWPSGKHTFTGSPPGAVTDSSGRARLEVESPGECSLTLKPPAESGSEFALRAPVTLQRGPNHWTHDIRTGRLEGTISGWDPAADVRWRLSSPDQKDYERVQIRPDAAGRFVVPMLAAGKLDIVRSRGQGSEQTRETVKSIELPAGQTLTISLP